MILGINIRSFFIYLTLLIVGLALVFISAFTSDREKIWNEVFMAIGCGLIPTSVSGYLVDRVNTINRNKQKKNLRKSILWGIPAGVLWILKGIIERYANIADVSSNRLIDIFNETINHIKKRDESVLDFYQLSKERDNFLSSINYGLQLCFRDSKTIFDNRLQLQTGNIFTEKELLSIQYLNIQSDMIKKCSRICEMAEEIELTINNLYGSFDEIKKILNRKVKFDNNGKIKNWLIISKE